MSVCSEERKKEETKNYHTHSLIHTLICPSCNCPIELTISTATALLLDTSNLKEMDESKKCEIGKCENSAVTTGIFLKTKKEYKLCSNHAKVFCGYQRIWKVA
jgi:hypothetical protein